MSEGVQKKKYLSLVYGGEPHIIMPVFKSPDWVRVEHDLGAVSDSFEPKKKSLSKFADRSFDAVSFQQCLQKIHLHEVPKIIAEFRRLLVDDGFVLITTPDLMRVVDYIKNEILEDPVYHSPELGAIYALDMVYGHRKNYEKDGKEAAYQSGYTASSLGRILKDEGFYNIRVKREPAQLVCAGHRASAGQDISGEKIRVIDPSNRGGLPDDLAAPPIQWKPLGLITNS